MEKKLEAVLAELNKLGVHDLREIARSYGIFAPTLLKREELLEKISDKMCGEDPNKGKAPTKRGRPPKTKFISKIRVDVPSNLAFMTDASFSNDCFQTLTDFEAALFLKEDTDNAAKNAIVIGVLQSVNNGESNYFYAINKQTKKFETVVFVPKIFISEYSLRVGDKIKGSSIESDTPNIMMLTSILQVNDNEPKSNVERTFHGFDDATTPTQKVKFEQFEFFKGERVLMLAKTKQTLFEQAVKIAEACAAQFDKVLFVGVEIPQEQFSALKALPNTELFLSEYGDALSIGCNAILSSTDHAQSLLSEGKNIAIIYFDLLCQANLLETKLGQFEHENVYGFREKTVIQIKKAFSIAKATANNDGSITSIVTCIEEEKNNDLIAKNFVMFANKIF